MQTALTDVIAAYADRIDAVDADSRESLEAAATLTHEEWLLLGDKASLALASGKIAADIAQHLHSIHTRFNTDATLAERVVFTQVMGELL